MSSRKRVIKSYKVEGEIENIAVHERSFGLLVSGKWYNRFGQCKYEKGGKIKFLCEEVERDNRVFSNISKIYDYTDPVTQEKSTSHESSEQVLKATSNRSSEIARAVALKAANDIVTKTVSLDSNAEDVVHIVTRIADYYLAYLENRDYAKS